MKYLLNYCENCRVVCKETYCPNCGKKKLRAVEDDDYCYVTEEANSLNEYFCKILERQNVKCVNMAWFSALDTCLAVKASRSRLYVRFKDFDIAVKTVQDYYNEITENLRKHLLDNSEQFSIDLPVEKKARKKLKLSVQTDIFEYCEDIIRKAKVISDTGCLDGLEDGHVLLAMTDNEKLYINSATYHIIDLGKR